MKYLEIRDRSTFIPCFAFKPDEHDTSRLAWRAGFGPDNHCVIFGILDQGGRCQYDPFAWSQNPRTMHEAHLWIQNHWDEIKDGDVIDVEFNAGETTTKKTSEL
jgi:hypothetical protein